jgi:transposase
MSSINSQRGPRKYIPAEKKLQIVNESFEQGKQVAEVARNHNVGVSSLIKWRKQAVSGSLLGVKCEEDLVPHSEVKKLKKQIRDLERMLGKKSMQVELLKEAVEIGREKKLISRQPLPGLDDIAND